MTYENQILLGRIVRIQGFDGTVVIRLEKRFVEKIPEMESVFIENEGRQVPFFIASSEYQGGDFLKLRFDGYQAYDKIIGFIGSGIFLTTHLEIEKSELGNEEISGFRIILKEGGVIGTVTGVIHNPGQDLLKIATPENREILIPLHADLIVLKDMKSKTIIMDLPEGLISLNL